MRYAEIHAKTNFSFLEGASHPAEMVERAAELGYHALAVTDRNSLAGVVRAHGAAKDVGLKLLVGAEITPNDAPPVVLLATDRAAYARLARLITIGRRRAEKGDCRLTFDDVAQHADGLIAGIVPPDFQSPITNHPRIPNPQSSIPKPPVPQHSARGFGAPRALYRYRDAFADRCYLLAELHHGPDDRQRLARLSAMARGVGVPLAAAGGARYHVPERQALCDVLTAVRLGCTVAEAGAHLLPNAERHLREVATLERLFADVPDAPRRSVEIADRCTFSLDELRYEYPEELAPPGISPMEHLRRLAWSGARERYPAGVPRKVRQLLGHELKLIEELRYEAYFLTVWDLVRFARERGILCQGRGSAANSAVCYCLGITSVDPERTDLLFERFVSRERNEAPDIDVDFEHQRREEVLQYLYDKYGRDRAGMTGVVISYRPRSAVRDVGKALGVPAESVDRLAKQLEHFHEEPDLPARCRESGIDPARDPGRQLVELVGQLVGFPRHLSQHTGGMVMTQGPLCELVPIENASMPGRTVIEWNKDDLDELGILKVDCLALGMLSAIHRCFDLVERHHDRRCTLANIPQGDAATYAMIQRADTMGVFQIESRAQMSMLPRLRPKCFYDLVIEVAIVRPGPIQGDMVHPYLRRRNGEEQVEYPNQAVREVLHKTLGVPLFQEQAMRLAVVAAGFTPGEADQLRRAMGAWRRPGLIDQFRRKLIEGMLRGGFSREYADSVFNQLRGFGDYGFPESHAASFALLVYVSAWLKCHYPAAFTAALLNSQPVGFYAPAQLIRDVRSHGVEVRPVDVNHGEWECTLEPTSDSHPALRLGFNRLEGFREDHARRIVAARRQGTFRSMDDFARRTGLSRAVLARLSRAGVFDSLALDRRAALWHALAQDDSDLPLFDRPAASSSEQGKLDPRQPPAADEAVPAESAPSSLPKLTEAQQVLADYQTQGLSLRAHPMKFLREELAADRILRAEQLATWRRGARVRVAGIVLVRQRPSTARGITFITLEDETGQANLIVRPAVWQRFRPAALGATLLLAEGVLQREQGVIHILTSRLENLSTRLADLAPQSRNFC